MQATVAISYFHRKIGPMVYYSYPENSLKEEERIKISDIMDQAFEEGFFTHRFGALSSMNYYFEIQSEWARGNKEMLMVSIIFDSAPSPDVETIILSWCMDFSVKLKNNKEIYKAFYNTEDSPATEADFQDIKKFSEDLKFWVRELYWMVIEELREKTEEEKWAALLSQTSIFKMIKVLSKGPSAMEDLTKWYNNNFHDNKLQEILQVLEQDKFIFVNSIGQETFVLLVKDVNVTRVPPNYIIDLKEDSPELADLIEENIAQVREFFEDYQPSLINSLNLFKLFANPKIYMVISQLREGPIPKEKIFSTLSDKTTKSLIENLELLKEQKIIQEFNYGGDILYILKTDVVFTASFPEYLKELLPRESKGYIAKAYSPGVLRSAGDEENILENDLSEAQAVLKSLIIEEEENPQSVADEIDQLENVELESINVMPSESHDNDIPPTVRTPLPTGRKEFGGGKDILGFDDGETQDANETEEVRKRISDQLRILLDSSTDGRK